MKIHQQIRNLHSSNTERYERLKEEVSQTLKPKVEDEGWFYIARIKGLVSFALKIETGRVSNPESPDDFFACTIVVKTISEVIRAEELVLSIFDSFQRRPQDDSQTHKKSSEFVFDDLRMYVKRRPSDSGRNTDLDGIMFEVQIKTVLQYAWGIATHDLIYKTNNLSWPKERIAYQVKAMLEHAEVVIAEAEELSNSPLISKIDKRTKETQDVINKIDDFWPQDALPDDKKRLAENILSVLKTADLNSSDLIDLLNLERNRIGILPRDLSPYAFLVQALANNQNIDFETKFKRAHIKTCILIHQGMELPSWMKSEHERIVNLNIW